MNPNFAEPSSPPAAAPHRETASTAAAEDIEEWGPASPADADASAEADSTADLLAASGMPFPLEDGAQPAMAASEPEGVTRAALNKP